MLFAVAVITKFSLERKLFPSTHDEEKVVPDEDNKVIFNIVKKSFNSPKLQGKGRSEVLSTS
jgi:hypothetical protein